MADAGVRVQVVQGRVRGYRGVAFAGRNAVPGNEREAAKVRISVWDERSAEEFSVYLHEGDTFEISGQTWRLDEIHYEGLRRWYADLTRIA